MELFGHSVQPATYNDLVVFWSCGDERRCIVGVRYVDLPDLLHRVFRRLPTGPGLAQSLRAKTLELREPGSVIRCVMPRHCVGVMRPFVLSREGLAPFVVSRGEARNPVGAVLCSSREQAIGFVRNAERLEGIPTQSWCGFVGGRERAPFEQILRRADGLPGARTDLEEAITDAVQAERSARIAGISIERRATSKKLTGVR